MNNTAWERTGQYRLAGNAAMVAGGAGASDALSVPIEAKTLRTEFFITGAEQDPEAFLRVWLEARNGNGDWRHVGDVQGTINGGPLQHSVRQIDRSADALRGLADPEEPIRGRLSRNAGEGVEVRLAWAATGRWEIEASLLASVVNGAGPVGRYGG